ncbi:MAG: VanZ family protein [Pseudomonadota bacterium]
MSAEPALRWPLLWASGGILLSAYVIYGALTRITLFVPTTIWDKASHALAFFVLTVWFSALTPRRRLLQLALAMLVFGIAIEVAQSFTATRQADVLDVVADVIGIAAGAGLAWLGLRRWALWAERIVGRAVSR